ncbi:uncharacterized protein LOC127356226 [Dicentrarchus labrax]|uniref:uncharacterized protein LOC127356226 n=1 Tax=Dicentrarchus labrax TaxID=13489 RepID=UPI0021F5C285|nr:uncharacterized protein LOC127356226 [Dicentrarchus labrax]
MSQCEETEEVVDPPETSLCEQHGRQTEAQRVPLKPKASTGSECLSYWSQDHINAEVESGVDYSSSSEDEGVVPDDVDQLQSEKERSGQWDIDFRRDQSKEDINVKEKRSSVRKKRKKTFPDRPGFSFPMERYRPTFRHGLSANVLSTVSWLQEHHEWMLEPQDLESYWSTDSTGSWDMETGTESSGSSVSFKSDRSKEEIIYFRKRLSRLREEEEMKAHISERSATSSASFESDNSKKVKVDFKEGQSPPREDWVSSSSSSSEEDVAADDGDRDTTSDSKESTTSSVSFKSDRSKDKIINFKDGSSALRKKDETSLSTTPVV